jgi:hypothetical protein
MFFGGLYAFNRP